MTSLRTVACCAVSEPTPARGRVDRLSDLPHLPPMPKTMLLLAVLGAIHYWPADKQGIFLLGGTTRFLAGAGLDYRQAVLRGWDLMGSLGYEFHRFSTEELRVVGFSQTQSVNRFALSVGLARST